MTTILEALQNANCNIKENGIVGVLIGGSQLNNAVVLLEKGYDLHDDVEKIFDEYGDLENVPVIYSEHKK